MAGLHFASVTVLPQSRAGTPSYSPRTRKEEKTYRLGVSSGNHAEIPNVRFLFLVGHCSGCLRARLVSSAKVRGGYERSWKLVGNKLFRLYPGDGIDGSKIRSSVVVMSEFASV